jgi:thiamine transporter ThiT
MLSPRYRKLVIALGAVATLLIARETGLDRGLIDAVMDGLVEVVVEPDPIEPEAAQ